MNTTEFRAAVEKIIGVPPEIHGNDIARWQVQVSGGMMNIDHSSIVEKGGRKFPYFLFIRFPYFFRPKLGEDPSSGGWNIQDRFFNYDPEAVLRELVRRLAVAGWEGPAGVKLVKTDPAKFRATDEQITEWLERHDIRLGLTDGRAAFDDAQSFYLTQP
jgi:hypothetical protein